MTHVRRIRGSWSFDPVRVDQLFDAGLDIELPRRQAWLAEQTADEAVRREVLDLLEKAAAPAEVLEPEAFASGALMAEILVAGSAEPSKGTRIGAWRILEKLGQGGMGTVYRVERADGAYEHQAALKLIRPEAWNDEVGRRLEAERQILAQLDHANIARLLDGGAAADGRPYLVMELVEGSPIDTYCDARRLSIDRRLELFAQVCLAVQHAHRALVVHRDLKPSNVLVTSGGRVKLLDFGIARALEPAAGGAEPITRAADRVMTPDYASPEQILGHAVTTATDVYQLGLLLFELTTGERAQRSAGLGVQALVQAICERPAGLPSAVVAASADPRVAAARDTMPRALARQLRGDLDAMVAVALRKEPERRYASAGHLFEDVERHRRGLPVQARPAAASYRLRCFLGRHRRAVAGAAVGVGLAAWIGVFSAGERIRALREAERARQVEAVIGSLFEYPRVTESGRPPQMKDFVDHAALLIRRHLHGQPASRARLLARLARTYSSLGAYDLAARTFDEAIDLSGPGASRERAGWIYQRGRNRHFAGAFEAAEASFRQAAALRRELHGKEHLLTIAVELELADLLHSLARLREAQALLEPMVESLRARESREARELLVQAQGYLGNVLRDRGAGDRAHAAYEVAVRGMLELLGERDPRTSSHSIHFARLLALRGRYLEAEERLVVELERLREVHFGDHPLVATALRELAFAEMGQGELDDATLHLARAFEITAAWLPPEHPTIARLQAIEAELERRGGHSARSLEVSRQALDLFSRLGLPGHPSALDACITVGRSARELGRPLPDWARPPLEKCRAAAERELVAGDPRTRILDELS